MTLIKNHISNKKSGDPVSHEEWNALASDVNELAEQAEAGTGGVVSTEVDSVDNTKTYVKISDLTVAELTSKGEKGTNLSLAGNNNINIEPRPAAGTGEDKNTPGLENRKGGNISLKPGDDIELCSHKRGTGKNTEVAVKVMDGSENPVKLQVFAGDITLSTKGKNKTKTKDATGADTSTLLYNDPNVMNINVTTGNGKGYLKVRAHAIDLRCEDHGGIALQPKGADGDGNMNKIKFEHGGGDGLEFGTFNTEHTSIFTGDYRFKKDGIIRLATRFTEVSDKADNNDPTTAYKYMKNNSTNNAAKATSENKTFNAADDFYDFVDSSDPTCTWEDIVSIIAELKSMKQNNQGPWAQV